MVRHQRLRHTTGGPESEWIRPFPGIRQFGCRNSARARARNRRLQPRKGFRFDRAPVLAVPYGVLQCPESHESGNSIDHNRFRFRPDHHNGDARTSDSVRTEVQVLIHEYSMTVHVCETAYESRGYYEASIGRT